MPHGLTRNKETRVASTWMLGRCQAWRSCVRIRWKRKQNFCSALIGPIRGATWNPVIGPCVTSRLNRMAESPAQSTHLPRVALGGRHITATCQSVQPHQCHASFCTATCLPRVNLSVGHAIVQTATSAFVQSMCRIRTVPTQP